MSGKRALLIVGVILVSIYLINRDFISRQEFCVSNQVDKSTMTKGNKTALLIHGYPEPIYKDHPLYKYFTDRGYSVIAPYLFTPSFKLTREESKKYLENKLSGKSPDVIVGLSLGSLIAPYIAKDYPDARLVMIAAGPYIDTKIGLLNQLIRFSGTSAGIPFIESVRRIPTSVYSIIYKFFNHPPMTAAEKQVLEDHIKKNWACLAAIPIGEDREVIDFLTSTNNSEILKSLTNKTLIFGSDGDIMMPVDLSQKLKSLIKDSQIVITKNRIHFNVFEASEDKYLDKFLGNAN